MREGQRMTMIQTERSLGELFSDLSREVSFLFQQEVQLAKAEMTQKASTAGRSMIFIATGGLVAYAGFLALLAAIVLGLAEFMAGWLAALIVGVVIAGVGYLVLQKGIDDLKNMKPAPEQTIAILKEDGQWLKQQLS
jgi:hypothetical protein